MEGVRTHLANVQGSGAKIRVENAKAISNSGICIGKPMSGIIRDLLWSIEAASQFGRQW